MSDLSNRRADGRREAPAPIHRPTRLQALLLFGIAALAPFAEVLYDGLIRSLEPNAANLAANSIYYLLFLALPIFLCFRRGPGRPEALRPNPLPISSMLAVVGAALLCVFLANDIILLWSIPFQKLGFNLGVLELDVPANARGLTVCVLYAAVLPGICEELLLRGALLSAFEEEGTKRARLVTALLFTLLHGSIIGAPTQFMLGMILADIVLLTDSIYGGMIFHTVYNATLLILQALQQGAGEAAPVENYFTAIGGWGGVVSLLVSIAITGMMVRFCLSILRLRAKLEGRSFLPRKRIPLRGAEMGVLIAALVLVALRYLLVTAAMLV